MPTSSTKHGRALKQRTATAEVLKVINRSAYSISIQSCRRARDLCRHLVQRLDKGIIWLRKGDLFRSRATFGHSAEGRAFVETHPRSLDDKSLVPRVARSGRDRANRRSVAGPRVFLRHAPRVDQRVAIAARRPPVARRQVEGVFTLTRALPAPFATRQIEKLVEAFRQPVE